MEQIKRIYKEDDGVISIWTYDFGIFKNGPIIVENEYPNNANIKTYDKILEENQKNIPLSKRKWINPKNGKFVAYCRAKNLGLI